MDTTTPVGKLEATRRLARHMTQREDTLATTVTDGIASPPDDQLDQTAGVALIYFARASAGLAARWGDGTGLHARPRRQGKCRHRPGPSARPSGRPRSRPSRRRLRRKLHAGRGGKARLR